MTKNNICLSNDDTPTIVARTSMRKCWDMIRKIKGKGGGLSVKHIERNRQEITVSMELLQIPLGEAISHYSSSTRNSTKFNPIKNRQERHPLRFQ